MISVTLRLIFFKHRVISAVFYWLLFVTASFLCVEAHAHGGVFLEEDICVIQIGFFKAHFTIYQPQTSQHKQFCEDIPELSESVFVIEYLHDAMRSTPVDFRIIKDTEDRGRFVTWEELKSIDGLKRDTVFYQAPLIRPDGVFLALHNFTEKGNYIGIMTVQHSTSSELYTAVFPFRVGGRDWGAIPLLITIIILVQLSYWLMNGGYARLRKKIKFSK